MTQQTVERGVARNARGNRLDLGGKQQVDAPLSRTRLARATGGRDRGKPNQDNEMPAHLKPAVYVRPTAVATR